MVIKCKHTYCSKDPPTYGRVKDEEEFCQHCRHCSLKHSDVIVCLENEAEVKAWTSIKDVPYWDVGNGYEDNKDIDQHN